MARPICGQDYPYWNVPVLDQEYPRWNNLFDTIDFDDADSLRKILHTSSIAETFHPFSLKLREGETLSDAEMIAVRDLSYAFNRNHLCRDMVLHLMLFSRYDDEYLTLGKEAKFYTEMLKKTDLSPVHQPDTYMKVRREFRRLAPDMEDLDESKAKEELNRWASWGLRGIPDNTDSQTSNGVLEGNFGSVHDQSTEINIENGSEDLLLEFGEKLEVLEAAKILISISTLESIDSSVVTSVPAPRAPFSRKRKREESDNELYAK